MNTPLPSQPLTTRQRQFLRGLAHSLDPVARIGQQGLTEAVVEKVNEELEAHELIKVKVGDGCLDPVKDLVALLSEQTGAVNVQVIGRVGVLYRRRKKDPEIVLPRAQKES